MTVLLRAGGAPGAYSTTMAVYASFAGDHDNLYVTNPGCELIVRITGA